MSARQHLRVLLLRRIEAIAALWPLKKTTQTHQEPTKGKTKEDYEIERCLKLVIMDFRNSAQVFPEESEITPQVINIPFMMSNNGKMKQIQKANGHKHNQKKCPKCRRLYYVVNILVEGCLMALVRQSLEHVDLLITKMELKDVTDPAVFHQYLQHGLTLSDKVENFYQHQDRMYDAFKVCARMQHSKAAQGMIKQGFDLLNEMRELNNKYQVSIDNFCNLMAENSGVPIENN